MSAQKENPGLQEALRRIEEAKRTNSASLDLSSLRLTVVPPSIGDLPQLRTLDLSGNRLSAIPEAISELRELESLHAEANLITSIPDSIAKLSRLRVLALWSNQISVVSERLAKLCELQELNLGGNRLGVVPEVVLELTQLQALYLWENQISTIPEFLIRLSQLRLLNLARNEITAIPEFIGRLTKLKELALWENQIKVIPESLCQLTYLQHFGLSHNAITTIPNFIGQLSQLKFLNFTSNGISIIPESLAQLAMLQTFKISKNKVLAIPDFFGELSRLQRLDFSDNAITNIPASLGQLSQLKELALKGNGIESIPSFLGQLSELEELDLGSNRITVIPDPLVQLSKLRRLDVSNNKIAVAPSSIGRLSELSMLNLSTNKITAVPDSIGWLSQLQDLDLSNNEIADLPSSIAKLSGLMRLDLRNNQLTVLPDQLTELKQLGMLFLHGNSALRIPDEILGPTPQEYGQKPPKPPQEILAYIFKIADSRPLNEAKLILVGQGNVGKTSLVKALTTGKFKKGEKTTEGIKISDWECKLNRKENATVHIWDFGGQEMMHATHQFFLTQRSLYMLVLNRRQGGADREADYWFRLIRAFGGKDAPVIVVLNKLKTEPFEVNREGWLEKYGENIKGFVLTDCEDKKSINQLKRKIVDELNAMQSLKARFPRRWVAIKSILSQMQKEHITFEDYRKLCQEHGESDPAGQTSLAGFLHDLGIALNYRQDPRLRFNYVLKPDWVTQGIYALLHAFVRKKGVFTHTEAERELAKKRYSAEDTQFILGLMERFELSFSLGDKQNRVLIPELLEDQQPKDAAAFRPEDCLNFGYKYTVLPEGLLPRFIARTHHLGRTEGRWKSGVILEDRSSSCRALVRAHTPEAEIRVHIVGPEEARRELLGIIRYNLEVIHSDYEFQPEAQVFPPAAPQKALSVDELEALARSKATTVPVVLPDKSVINQDIASLIDPLATPPPLKLFLSYSHLEEHFINELRKDLKLMEMNGQILPWYDRSLTAGDEWEPSILQQLKDANIVICQLSRNYLASDNCVRELKLAMELNQDGVAALAAYVLTDCGWREFPGLAKLQLLPTDGKPLSDWSDPNKYWRAVIDGIQSAVKKQQSERKARPDRGRELKRFAN